MIRVYVAGARASSTASISESDLIALGDSFYTGPSITNLRIVEEVLRPLSVPWWHLHDVPELLDPPAQVDVPHRAFRPVHQPGLSGKRTRQSQKLHNRRAA